MQFLGLSSFWVGKSTVIKLYFSFTHFCTLLTVLLTWPSFGIFGILVVGAVVHIHMVILYIKNR